MSSAGSRAVLTTSVIGPVAHYSEREGDDRGCGEPGAFAQGTNRVANILQETVEPLPGPFVAALVFCQIERTELAASAAFRFLAACPC